MPIIHVRISYNFNVLKDWEGLPVEKETKIKDFFEEISVSYLSPDMWDADFEVKFSQSKKLVGEKVSERCIAWEAACQYGIYANFYIMPQQIIEPSRMNIFHIVKNVIYQLKVKREEVKKRNL